VETALGPALASIGDPPFVQGLADLLQPVAPQGALENLPDDGRGGRIDRQRGPFFQPIVDLDASIAEGRAGRQEVAARRGLAHPPHDLLRQILAIELVHALDDGLHELAGRRVVGGLGDGDHPDALAPQHGLEGHGVLALAGETGELPDEDDLEGGVGPAALVDHLPELRPVGHAPTLGLVHVLASHDVAVRLGIVSERPQLGGDGKVHVLAVAGDPGVERRRRLRR